MMNRCAAAGLVASGTRFTAASIFSSAFASGTPLPVMCAPPSSAANSRDRLIAAWMSIAANGASNAVASSAIGLPPPSRSLLRPPPNIAPQRAMSASIMIAAPSVAATD